MNANVVGPEFTRRTRADGALAPLLIDGIPSPIGVLMIVVRDPRLCALDYEDSRGRLLDSLASRYGALDLRKAVDPLGVSTKLRAYFDGDLGAIDTMPVETGGTAFQRQVWAALRGIAPGTTVSYRDLAGNLG